MALPFFYIPSYSPEQAEIVLDEDNSRHIVQVLRMKPGEELLLTDGKGTLLEAEIRDDHKKKCLVGIKSSRFHAPPPKKTTLAISLLKNANRFEWMLEKAMEIGISEIIPLLCERTEKQHFRQDRMQHILVSALLQSQQVWLPVLHAPTPFPQMTEKEAAHYPHRYIAHCLEADRVSLAAVIRDKTAGSAAGAGGVGSGSTGSGSAAEIREIRKSEESVIILIGPEGDFSKKEIELALQQGYMAVTLGENRLRTETAGIVAATLLCID